MRNLKVIMEGLMAVMVAHELGVRARTWRRRQISFLYCPLDFWRPLSIGYGCRVDQVFGTVYARCGRKKEGMKKEWQM